MPTLTPEEQLKQQVDQFSNYLNTELERVRTLPEQDQDKRMRELQYLGSQAKQNFKEKSFLAQAGVDITDPIENQKEGTLDYIFGSLTKLNSGKNKIITALSAPDVTEKEKRTLLNEAVFDLLPFSETITGIKTDKLEGKEVLRRLGVQEGGSLSDLLPGLFNETGEGAFKFQKGGPADITSRGLKGFAFDAATDPLNFVPVGKGVRAGAKGVDSLFKKAAGQSIRSAAYNSPALVKTARAFNKFAFLSKDPDTQKSLEKIFRTLMVKQDNLPVELLDDGARLFKDAQIDDAVIDTMRHMDDVTRASKGLSPAEFAKKYPSLNSSAIELYGKVTPDAIGDIITRNSGLNAKQMAGVQVVKNIFEEQKITKKLLKMASDGKLERKVSHIAKILKSPNAGERLDKLLARIGDNANFKEELESLKAIGKDKTFGPRANQIFKNIGKGIDNLGSNEEKAQFLIGVAKLQTLRNLNKNFLPNYFPRSIVDTKVLDDVGLDVLKDIDPEISKLINDKIIPKKELNKIVAQEGIVANPIVHGQRIYGSVSDAHRVFPDHATAANYAKAMQGRLENNISKIFFKEQSRIKRKAAVQNMQKDLLELYGEKEVSRLPQQVQDTLKQVINKGRDPDSLGAFNRMWNKHFLNPLKYSLTMPFPAFHIRNIIDDTYRGYEEFGAKFLNPKLSREANHILGTTDKVIDLGGGISMTAREMYEKFVNLGIYRNTFIRTDLIKTQEQLARQFAALNPVTKTTLRKAWERLPLNEDFAIRHMNKHRLKGGIQAMRDFIAENGLKAGDDLDAAFLEASKRTGDAFIDIHDLGPLDDMLAQVIPFYRFTRKNIPFQLKTLTTHPERVSKLALARDNFSEDKLTEEDKQALAPYLRDSFLFSLGNDVNGNHLVMTGLGLGIEELGKVFSTESWTETLRRMSVAQAAPPIQYVLGMIFNKHPFFGTELNDFRTRKTYKAFYENPLLNKLVGGVERVPLGKDDKGNVQYRYELENPTQYFKVTTIFTPLLSAATAHVPGGKLLSGAVSARGLDTYGKIEDDQVPGMMKALRLTTGLNITEQDLNRNKIRQMITTYREQNDALKQESRRIKAWMSLGQEYNGSGFDGLTEDEQILLDLSE